MGIQLPDKTFFKIGEAASIVGVEPHTIRYWEKEFRAIKPAKTRSQQRLFRQRDVLLLLLIRHLLHDERFTIDGANRKLKELSAAGITIESALDAIERGQPLDPAAVPTTSTAALEATIETLRTQVAKQAAEIAALRATAEEELRRDLAHSTSTNDALRDTVSALRAEVERLRAKIAEGGQTRAETLDALRTEMGRRWRAVLQHAVSKTDAES